MTTARRVPLRLLIVLPSWVGDVAMATPALARIRRTLKGSFIGALARPGIDEVLSGSEFFDETHVFVPQGIMAPKHAAAKVRPRQYDTALLLTNSFSTALITRLAGIPNRIGFDKDARGLLLTDSLDEPHDPTILSKRTPVPAVDWYWALSERLLNPQASVSPKPTCLPPMPPEELLSLATTPADEAAADELLSRAGVSSAAGMAILIPGGNNPLKRWPAERFAALAAELGTTGKLKVLINGSPAEAELCAQVASAAGAINLAALGNRIGTLKALVRRAKILITNDTGPRYFALAFGTPCVALYGPTDVRWTRSPASDPSRHIVLRANENLPRQFVADDYADDCRIDRIAYESVRAACNALLHP